MKDFSLFVVEGVIALTTQTYSIQENILSPEEDSFGVYTLIMNIHRSKAWLLASINN